MHFFWHITEHRSTYRQRENMFLLRKKMKTVAPLYSSGHSSFTAVLFLKAFNLLPQPTSQWFHSWLHAAPAVVGSDTWLHWYSWKSYLYVHKYLTLSRNSAREKEDGGGDSKPQTRYLVLLKMGVSEGVGLKVWMEPWFSAEISMPNLNHHLKIQRII